MRSLFLWALVIGVIAFMLGFWNFAHRVRAPAETPPRADAIVALTGGSLERLTTGVRESAASALSSVERPVLSLTEQLAREHGTIEAVPPPALVRARTR